MTDWISVKDRLPEIPEGKYGVSIIGAMFDRFDFNNGQRGYFVQHGHYGEHKNSLKPVFLFQEVTHGDYEPMEDFYNHLGICITHWMYEPSVEGLEKLKEEEKANENT